MNAEQEFKRTQEEMKDMQKMMVERGYKEDSLEVSIEPPGHIEETPEAVN